MVVFTKQEYRALPGVPGAGSTAQGPQLPGEEHKADEGEVFATGGVAGKQKKPLQGGSTRKRQRKDMAGSAALAASKGSRGGSKGSKTAGPKGRNRLTFKDWQQRTLDEFLVK
jgi:hypothetical protein